MLTDVLEKCKGNVIIADAFTKADSIINDPKYDSILCSISGGSDSDVMLDLIHKVDIDKKVQYIWFNTGLEYQATKNHLEYLENRYDIQIHRERAIKPIPLCTKEHGQPFLSKRVSDMMWRLQEWNFQWEDEPFDKLLEKYPNCRSALKWWCNMWAPRHTESWGYSMFNISYNRYLKDFIVQNPPTFKISGACCDYAKKKVSKQYIKQNKIQLSVIGVRRAEGGARSSAYTSCFDAKNSHHNYDNYRPIFWFENVDKSKYDNLFDIQHSDCYTEWGFKRTGCVGCPFNKHFADELQIVEQHEPMMYKAVCNVFKDSYEYTKMYRQFIAEQKKREKGIKVLF